MKDYKFIAYADESGTHDPRGKSPGSREAVVGGCVASVQEWAAFCDAWQFLLDKYGAPYFHFKEWAAASAIVRRKRNTYPEFGKNPYRNWELKHLDDFLIELAKVAGSGDRVMFGGYVKTNAFNKEKITGSKLFTDDPYEFCLNEFFKEFIYKVNIQWPNFNDPVSFFFDQTDDPKWRQSILSVFYYYQKNDSRFAEIIFADKKKHLPLQAADMIAYRNRQVLGNVIDKNFPKRFPELDEALFKSTFKIFENNPAVVLHQLLQGPP
jgi:hypothetical protein